MRLHERFARWTLARRKLAVIPRRRLQVLRSEANRGRQADRLLGLLAHVQPAYAARALELVPQLHGQHFQDLIAALLRPAELGPGYYVEFGAADGVKLSNTLLLERLGWQGILAEPGRNWHAALRANRSAYIATDCVWSASGSEVLFSEAHAPLLSGVTSTHDRLPQRPQLSKATYSVRTIALNDLLAQAGAPPVIDFLSIDTEGSELAILTPFRLAERQIRLIAVEHNKRPDRADIAQLLGGHGYRRILEPFSAIDDWYVHPAAYAQAAAVFRLG
jgi:FkbM family methyltransferase